MNVEYFIMQYLNSPAEGPLSKECKIVLHRDPTSVAAQLAFQNNQKKVDF